jgi:hypothetical protein
MTPGKNAVKSNAQFRASAPSGAAPCKTIAESKTPMGSPKSTKRYQWESDPPPQQADQQISHAFLATRGRSDQEGRKGQPQDCGERLDHRERQFNGQDAEPISREEDGDQADPSEPERQDEEGRHRVAGNQPPESGMGCGSPIRTVRYGHQGLLSILVGP